MPSGHRRLLAAVVVVAVIAFAVAAITDDVWWQVAGGVAAGAASTLWYRATGTQDRWSFDRVFDPPFYRDPLFRIGLILSVTAVWSTLIVVLALGKTHDAYGLVVSFLLLPVIVTMVVFGVIGCTVRGFWRGWSGTATPRHEAVETATR